MLKPSQIKHCRQCGQPIAFAQTAEGKWYPAQVEAVAGGFEMILANNGANNARKRKRTFPSFPRLHVCPRSRVDVAAELDRTREQLMDAEAAAECESEPWWDFGPDITRLRERIAQLESTLAGMP